MVLQHGLLGKCHVAQRASERLKTSVDTNVSQIILLRKDFSTDQTEILSVFLQVAHIALKVLKDFVTLSA